ncbi:MAG: DNA-processing protein DprA [Candidatus Omnitrophica bacterium]|nr:DNA-processing protein DprA [Candidatus Omnitrophota bacterium]
MIEKMTELEAFVGLNLISNIGSVRLSKLLEVFGKPQEIFSAKYEHLASISGIGGQIASDIVAFKKENIEKELSFANKRGIKILTLNDDSYPKNLRQIPGVPIVLYVLGNITEQDDLAFGIVGSRSASFYGLSSAGKFAAELSAYGITIVSGMARGVDTYAHRGALKVKGRTIAVMGSGFNNIYPAENADLAKEISLSGAVISEFSMETKPLAQNFPRRNRLISGLSCGVLITEAARNSGALITADFALEQGREVFALPGRIDSAGSIGANELLKQGARLVTCCDDILEELNLVTVSKKEAVLPQENQKVACTDDENMLYECISRQPVAIDDLVEKTSLSSSKILSLILKLQFKKLIKELPGKQFMRN